VSTPQESSVPVSPPPGAERPRGEFAIASALGARAVARVTDRHRWIGGADGGFAPPLLCSRDPVTTGPDFSPAVADAVDPARPSLYRLVAAFGLPPGVAAELPRFDALARDRDVVAAREERAPEAQEVAAAFSSVGHGASVATGAEAGQ
jgi:hypothetical protein